MVHQDPFILTCNIENKNLNTKGIIPLYNNIEIIDKKKYRSSIETNRIEYIVENIKITITVTITSTNLE